MQPIAALLMFLALAACTSGGFHDPYWQDFDGSAPSIEGGADAGSGSDAGASGDSTM